MYNNFNQPQNMPTQFPQFVPPTSGPSMDSAGTRMAVPVDAAPYPEVSGGIDLETVALLKEDYAGSSGELTAITQYVFQSGRIKDNGSYANAILQIAIIEMMHLDMLGDAIVALGGTPTYDDGNKFWCGNNVNYSFDFKDMVKANIISEETAISNYQKHAAQTNNQTVKALLNRIIEDEQLHLKFFQDLFASLT